MTLAAAATKTIKVASGVSLVIEHDPIIMAKQTATVDVLSGGRFMFGVGAGWLDTEMADHGVVYRTRFQLLREQLRAIKEIWTTGESEFHGKFVNFDPMRSLPKPLQKPHPPIIMGGEGEKAVAVAAELCNGWAPWQLDWPTAKETIALLKQRTAEAGRDPASLEISLFEKSIPGPENMAEMQAAGVQRIILTVLGQSREEALPRLDQMAKLM
jgi:probable F420-dependent oxidoreductase